MVNSQHEARVVGFVGLGTMGRSMALNMARGGVPVVVFNRTRERGEELQQQYPGGIRVAQSLGELAQSAETVCLCVSDDAALEEVLFGAQGLLSAQGVVQQVVDFSTVSPAAARSVDARLKARGITFIDAPVTGGDVGARNATLTVMAGGDESAVAALQPLFALVSARVLYMGPAGAGQLTKCVNQLACAVNIAAMSEALVFAQNAGLDLEKVVSVIGGGAAGSWALSNYAPRLLRGDLQPGFSAKLQLKDLEIVARETSGMPTPFPVLAVVRDLYRVLCAQGGGELGNHALITVYPGAQSA